MADYLNCNLDYLLDRTNNCLKVKDIDAVSNNQEINILIQNIKSMTKEQQDLVIAFSKGILNK